MNEWLALVILVSVAASVCGYCRALHLQLRISDIDPHFRGLVSDILDFFSHRKD